MNLVDVETGKLVRVVGFRGGNRLDLKLRQLGIIPGDCARVLRHAPFGGPSLIEIDGRAIALGRTIASKIEVEVSECASS